MAVVNTHWHWDHTFGNAAFREQSPGLPIHAHEEAAAMLAEKGEYMKGRFAESDDPHRDEVVETELVIARPHLLLDAGARSRRPRARAGVPGSRAHVG